MSFTVTATVTNVQTGVLAAKVFVVTGGTEAGGAVVCTGNFATPTFSMTPAGSGSTILVGDMNANTATALTPNANNTATDSGSVGSPALEYWFGHWTGTVTGGSAITTLGGTNDDGWNAWGAYEVLGAASALDASTPAKASGASPLASPAFTPPAGAVLVIMVESNGSAAQAVSISDTSGLGLTWTQRGTTYSAAFEGTFAIFTTTVPGASSGTPAGPRRQKSRRQRRRQSLPPVRYPKIETIVDDLAVNRLSALFPDTVGTVTDSGGQIVIKSDTSYDSAVVTNSPYDLIDSSIYIKIAPYVATSSDIQFGLFTGQFLTANNSLFCGFGGSTNFHVFKNVNGTQTNLFTTTYNAVSMAWWRIRESGGTTFFDTAPDGVTWTNQFSTPNGTFSFPLDAVGVSILGGDFGADAPGNTTVFAINTQPGSTSFSGSQTAPVTITASNTGAKRETQSDTAAVALAASAVGAKRETQASTAAITVTASCVGHKAVAASVSATTAYVASDTGAKRETKADTASAAIAASAVGAKRDSGSATGAVTITASCAGQIGTMSAAATASITVTASCVGHKAVTNSVTAPTAYVASNTGSKRETQTATAAVSLSATAVGSKREVGAGSALIALSGTVVGSKRVTASDSAAVSLAASAIGHKVETHAVTASVTITASCTGHKVVTQSDPALVALTGSATGHKVETQAVTASVAFVATAAGSKRETQADTATVTITASCVGSNPGGAPSGNPIAIVTVTASCTGSKRGVASATAAVSFAESAVGHKSGAHAATAAVSLVSSATGHKSGAHVATAAVSLAASLVGHKAGLGHPSALVSLTGSNAGTKRLVAASTASLSFNLANAASTARAGSAAAILEFLLTSIKGSPVNPVLPGTNVNYPPGTVVIGPSRALAPYYDQMGVGGIVMNPIGRMVISVVPPNGHVATFDMQTWKLIQNSDGSITLNRPQLQGPDGSSPA